MQAGTGNPGKGIFVFQKLEGGRFLGYGSERIQQLSPLAIPTIDACFRKEIYF